MRNWYYARDGRQIGPVGFEEIRRMYGIGNLQPEDLVWREGMENWVPAGEVEELKIPPLPANPYAYEPPVATAPESPPLAELPEILPGSQPIQLGKCIERAMRLVVRHFGIILIIGAIYLALTYGASLLALGIDQMRGYLPPSTDFIQDKKLAEALDTMMKDKPSPMLQLPLAILDVFLAAGWTRISLNMATGLPVRSSMLFGEGSKLLRMIGAKLLYMLMVGLGLLLFVAPGIYLAMRFGQYRFAIVDKNMGVFEAFAYSSRITENSRLPLLLAGLLSVACIFAGMLLLMAGLIFTLPFVLMLEVTLYGWLTRGAASARE